jgi:hypothetical protein
MGFSIHLKWLAFSEYQWTRSRDGGASDVKPVARILSEFHDWCVIALKICWPLWPSEG